MSSTPPYPVAPESTPFKIAPAAYLRQVLSGAKGKALVLVPAAIVAGFIVAAVLTTDVRFALVALILFFIAVPMVMSIAYFSIALSTEATRSTLLHTAELLPDGSIHIEYLPLEADNDTPSRIPFPPETITASEVKSIRISSDFIIYTLHSERLVIIPINSLNLPAGWHCHFRDFD